jgi:parallel beta-helix repeat protein
MSISSKMYLVAATLVASAALCGHSASAATVVVGPDTCEPGKAHYTTIQSAVSAVAPRSTVLVCPGTYPEQVTIAQSLTLKGVTDGTGNAAIITVPSGGLVLNATSPITFGGPVTAQIVIQNTTAVSVSNLTVDGTGSGCTSGATREVGIVAYNVVDSTVSDVVVRNELTACLNGEGIDSDSSSITISDNEVHGIDNSGIVIGGGVDVVNANSIEDALLYGISLDSTDGTTVTGNNVANLRGSDGGHDLAPGVALFNSNSSTISKNTFLLSPRYSVGVLIYSSSSNSVTGNTCSECGFGVYLFNAANNVVQSNKLSDIVFDGIFFASSLGGNIVSKNVVNEAAYGIYTDNTAGGDTLTPNSLFNTVVTVDPNPVTVLTPPQP